MTAPALPQVTSRSSWQAALLWGFEAAITQGARRIVAVDPDFADWPLDDAGLLRSLTDWLRLPQRRLVLLAAQFNELPRRCARFDAWRAPWSHAIEGWQVPEDLARDLPSVLVSDGAVSVQVLDRVHWRGRVALDERLARQWSEATQPLLERAERALAVRTLGL